MNKQRRAQLKEIMKLIEQVGHDMEEVRADEQTEYENLTETAQEGERGQAMQEAVDELQGYIDTLDEMHSGLDAL